MRSLLKNVVGKTLKFHINSKICAGGFVSQRSVGSVSNGNGNLLDKQMLIKLERLSGLRFENLEEIKALEEDIALANKVFEIDTQGIEPLYNIVEEIVNCPLRDDIVDECSKETVLKNAKSTIEDFFVTPKANVPLENNKLFDEIRQNKK